MRRNHWWKMMTLTGAVLALLAAMAFLGQPAVAEPTITVYKSPT